MGLTYEDIIALHIEQFGIEPVITGENFWQSDEIGEMILDAIDKGIPYIESDVPTGEVLT